MVYFRPKLLFLPKYLPETNNFAKPPQFYLWHVFVGVFVRQSVYQYVCVLVRRLVETFEMKLFIFHQQVVIPETAVTRRWIHMEILLAACSCTPLIQPVIYLTFMSGAVHLWVLYPRYVSEIWGLTDQVILTASVCIQTKQKSHVRCNQPPPIVPCLVFYK